MHSGSDRRHIRRALLAGLLLLALAASGCADGSTDNRVDREVAQLQAELDETVIALHATTAPRDDQVVWCAGHEDEVITAADALRLEHSPGPRIWVWDDKSVPGLTGGTISRKDEVIVSPDWVAAWELWRDEYGDEWSRACKAAHDNRWYFLTFLN